MEIQVLRIENDKYIMRNPENGNLRPIGLAEFIDRLCNPHTALFTVHTRQAPEDCPLFALDEGTITNDPELNEIFLSLF